MGVSSAPCSWRITTLGSVVELTYGKSLPAKVRDGELFPVFGSNGEVGKHSSPLVKTPGLIIGRKGSFGEVHISENPFFPIDTTYYVDKFYGQPIRYWFYQLRYLPLNQLNRATAIPGLNREDAYSQEIALPPLAEQKVIADKLDTLLAQVENTKARLERIPQILKRFRQSVLAAAVSGRLTEEWRGKSEYKSLDLGLEKSGEVIFCPEDWQMTTLTEACKVISGNAFKSNEFTDVGATPAIKISNVQYGSFEKKNQQYLPREYLTTYKRFEVLPGDLLMALTRPITNDTLKVCRYPISEAVGLLNQRVAKFVFHNERQKEFFELLFQSNYFKLQVYDKLSETLQPNLSPVNLKKFIISLPSGNEQTEIVRRVDQLFAHADRIEQQVNSALTRVNNLTQSILAKAFRGELTKQWRKDNPDLISGENSAEALLKSIKAERARSASMKRRS
ncbi:restriction endonuclease subunit S [Marinobacter sp. TBZ242]|uniref:Restriction endonuclease subunit S n=1 Tax=Marinobacter azerbaijanicus TaxID=3050455 RepID=A0ABT7IFT5_9GAMM|nr:restriction endonuclease subunit S [Marinobacter sp. TBZ242]MDL0433011.1 restriction endonuclease subunit S [Marinobacter sp. TBZ242]